MNRNKVCITTIVIWSIDYVIIQIDIINIFIVDVILSIVRGPNYKILNNVQNYIY